MQRALTDAESLAPWQRNLIMERYLEQLGSISKRKKMEVPIEPFDRRISFNIQELGKNPVSLRISDEASFYDDVRKVSERYVKKMQHNELLALGRNAGLADDQLSSFLEHRNLTALSGEAQEAISRELFSSRFHSALVSSRTPHAKKITGVMRAFSEGPESTVGALLELGQLETEKLTKGQIGLLTEADAYDYFAEWFEQGSGKFKKAEQVRDEILGLISSPEALSSSERFGDLFTTTGPFSAMPDSERVPAILRGRQNLEDARASAFRHAEGFTSSVDDASALADHWLMQTAHDLYSDTELFTSLSPDMQSQVVRELGLDRLRSAESIQEIADLHVPISSRPGVTFGDIGVQGTMDLLSNESLAEDYRLTLGTLLEKHRPSAVTAGLELTTRNRAYGRVFGAIDTGASGMLKTAGEVVSGKRGGGAKLAVIAATAGVAYLMTRRPEIRSDKEKSSSQINYRKEMTKADNPVPNRIIAMISGDTGGVPGVTDDDVVAAARDAVAEHMLGGVAHERTGKSSNQKRYDRRELDNLQSELMGYKGRFM